MNDKIKKLVENIKTFLEKKEYNYFINENDLSFVVGVEANNASFNILISIEPKAGSLGFHVTLFRCPNGYITPLNQLLMQINRTLRYGNFYLEENTDITFRLNYPIINEEFSVDLLDKSFLSVVVAVDTNYRKIAEALYGRFSEEDRKDWILQVRDFVELLNV